MDGTLINMTGLYVRNLIDSSPRDVDLSISRNGFSIASGVLTVSPSPNSLNSPSINTDVTGVSRPT